MGSFEALGLFDPNDDQDAVEDDEDMFLSASELLQKKSKVAGGSKLARSTTELELCRSTAPVPRSNTCTDLKRTVRAGTGLRVKVKLATHQTQDSAYN